MVEPAEAARPLRKRIVLHFTGFEPLDARAHHARYARVAARSARVWNHSVEVGALCERTGGFDVRASGKDWQVDSRIYIFEHAARIEQYRRRALPGPHRSRLCGRRPGRRRRRGMGLFPHGLALRPVLRLPVSPDGASVSLATVAIACLPPMLRDRALAHGVERAAGDRSSSASSSCPSRNAITRSISSPTGRWRCALARLDDPAINRLLADFEARVTAALSQPADEILISSHSIGLEPRRPRRRVAPGKEAGPLRRAQRRLRHARRRAAPMQPLPQRRRPAATHRPDRPPEERLLAGRPVPHGRGELLPEPDFRTVRPSPTCRPRRSCSCASSGCSIRAHYRKIKRDMLRVHRQYVLGPDRRADFDFTLLTAGPFRAASFAGFSPQRLPPLATTARSRRHSVAVPPAV